MKYSILINQFGIVSAGLSDSTDLIDWALLDYVAGWQLNPSATVLDGHIWINYQHLSSEMPMLGLTTKSAVSKRIKK